MSKTSSAVKNRYNEKVYDRLAIVLPKGRKEAVEAFAESHGLSVNGLVNLLLRDALGVSAEEWKNQAEAEER